MAATRRQEKELRNKYEKMKTKKDISPLERLRAHLLASGPRSIKNLHRLFKRIDVRGDKKIDFNEFKEALHIQGVHVTADVEKECFNQMDMDKSGTLDLDEFITALRPPMTQHRIELVHQAFNKLDKDGSGIITTDDLKGVYTANKHPKYISGEWTEAMVFEEFLNSFNGTGSKTGEVTMQDFENFYSGVSASIDSEAYFDLMMRKAWKL